ncbi:hypothetical protein TWF192_000830 [Orbilia oligospora]|nr:hypothetical protein TWF679_001661 [Orbilia oligospora]KAF3216928.1 hypothetical protein TWF191_008832 [Orbilia oligospora]KAF3257537.1 hypothetical protein TWF192_000830 [Orbilia oligospora]
MVYCRLLTNTYMLLVACQLLRYSEGLPLEQEPPRRDVIALGGLSINNDTTPLRPLIRTIPSPLPAEKSESRTGNASNVLDARKGGGARALYTAELTTSCLSFRDLLQITPEMYRQNDVADSWRAFPITTNYPDWREMLGKIGRKNLRWYVDFHVEQCHECECRIGEADDEGFWQLEASGTPGCPDDKTARGCQLIFGCYCLEGLFDPSEGTPGVLIERVGHHQYIKGGRHRVDEERERQREEEARQEWHMEWEAARHAELAPGAAEPFMLEGPDPHFDDNGGEGSSTGAIRWNVGTGRNMPPPQWGYHLPPDLIETGEENLEDSRRRYTFGEWSGYGLSGPYNYKRSLESIPKDDGSETTHADISH